MSHTLWVRPMPKELPPPVAFSPAFKNAVADAFYRDGMDGSIPREKMVLKGDQRTLAVLIGMRAGRRDSSDVRKDVATMIEMLNDNPNGVEIWIGEWDKYGGPEPVEGEYEEGEID